MNDRGIMNDLWEARLRADLSYWHPRMEPLAPTPRTRIVTTDLHLDLLLDGKEPPGFGEELAELRAAAEELPGPPWFLRTGHGSGKHDWGQTCFLTDLDRLGHHVCALVEWSALVDFIGLPTDTWAVREFLPLRASFRAFQGLPIAREFRAFFRDGEVLCAHPYWPAEAIRRPDVADWEERLREMSELDDQDWVTLWDLTSTVADYFEFRDPAGWSIDWAQDEDGKWWALDMAPLELSYHHGATRPEEPWTCRGYR